MVRQSEHARKRCGFRQSGCLTVWVGRLDMKKAVEGRVDEIKATFSAQLLLLYVYFMEHPGSGYYSILVNCRIQVDLVVYAVQYF